MVVDARASDRRAVLGDVSVLEWIRDRFAHTLDPVARTRLNARLLRIRAEAVDGRFAAAARTAAALR